MDISVKRMPILIFVIVVIIYNVFCTTTKMLAIAAEC